MEKNRPELIKQHIDSFPVLPATVTRLMTVTKDPESSAQDVMEVIVADQSLCLTILKIANSALFGRPKKVDSLRMAVSILGFNEVQRIALAKALINSFNKLAKHNKSAIDRFWQHSFTCGMIAKVIAEELHMSSEIAFMGGLIHDIGKLIMLEVFVDDYGLDWLTRFSSEQSRHEELHMFAFTHDVVGGQLLQQWFFPENLITAVEFHHRPGRAVREQGVAYVVQLADLLSFYCSNQDPLSQDDLLTEINRSLPGLESLWQKCGLSWENKAVVGWYNWLLENYDQGSLLKEAFTA
jgi:putative nucleotidyltransferase with HDIG domain